MKWAIVSLVAIDLVGGGTVADARVPKARDPNIAVQEEYQAATRKGRVEALDLFIARHPDHPLAAQARRERLRLKRKLPRG